MVMLFCRAFGACSFVIYGSNNRFGVMHIEMSADSVTSLILFMSHCWLCFPV